MQASNQKLDRIENRIRGLEHRSDNNSQEKSVDRKNENNTMESPYNLDGSPSNVRDNNFLAEDSKDTITRNERSIKRKKKTKSKKKDAEN